MSLRVSRLRFWIERAPVALLIAVALAQIFLSRTDFLLAWKGGGFGMFAVIDGVEFREVRAFDRDGERIDIPSSLFEAERRARTLPSSSALDRLAHEIDMESERVAGPDGQAIARLEVWRSRWRGEVLRPERDRIAERDRPR